MQEISIETCKKRKRIKKNKYQRERYHTNTDSNERFKQHQLSYYASKNQKINNLLLQYKDG